MSSPPGGLALVWTAGAEFTNQMHAYNAETGELVYTGGGTDEHMGNIRHFQVPIVVDGRLFVDPNEDGLRKIFHVN